MPSIFRSVGDKKTLADRSPRGAGPLRMDEVTARSQRVGSWSRGHNGHSPAIRVGPPRRKGQPQVSQLNRGTVQHANTWPLTAFG